MPKCLKCGAGPEWLQGKIAAEPRKVTEERDKYKAALEEIAGKGAKDFAFRGAYAMADLVNLAKRILNED